MRTLLVIITIILLAGCSKKPHGRYVAKVGSGEYFLELSYDFQENGRAITWIASGESTPPIPVKGRWRIKGDKIIFEGEYNNPKTKEKKKVI